MLNREKYAEEILNIACEGGNIALINGKLEKCRGVCDKMETVWMNYEPDQQMKLNFSEVLS